MFYPVRIARVRWPNGLLSAVAVFGLVAGLPAVAQSPAAALDRPEIRLFYAYPSVIRSGEKTSLCYGVSHVKSITVTPAVAGVWPAMNRCIEVTPKASMKWTLTATGSSGAKVQATTEVRLTRAAKAASARAEEPVQPTGPKIVEFVIREQHLDPRDGETVYKLCYEVSDAVNVAIAPPAFPAGPHLQGCFPAVGSGPQQFRLTAVDAQGRKVERQLTLTPPTS